MPTYSTTVLPGHRIEITAPELTEGICVELFVTEPPVEPLGRYPAALEAEYQALIDKELHRTLTEDEARRLQEVCNVIADIDSQTLTNDIRMQRLEEMEAKLADIRAQIDALPDAETSCHALSA